MSETKDGWKVDDAELDKGKLDVPAFDPALLDTTVLDNPAFDCPVRDGTLLEARALDTRFTDSGVIAGEPFDGRIFSADIDGAAALAMLSGAIAAGSSEDPSREAADPLVGAASRVTKEGPEGEAPGGEAKEDETQVDETNEDEANDAGAKEDCIAPAPLVPGLPIGKLAGFSVLPCPPETGALKAAIPPPGVLTTAEAANGEIPNDEAREDTTAEVALAELVRFELAGLEFVGFALVKIESLGTVAGTVGRESPDVIPAPSLALPREPLGSVAEIVGFGGKLAPVSRLASGAVGNTGTDMGIFVTAAAAATQWFASPVAPAPLEDFLVCALG